MKYSKTHLNKQLLRIKGHWIWAFFFFRLLWLLWKGGGTQRADTHFLLSISFPSGKIWVIGSTKEHRTKFLCLGSFPQCLCDCLDFYQKRQISANNGQWIYYNLRSSHTSRVLGISQFSQLGHGFLSSVFIPYLLYCQTIHSISNSNNSLSLNLLY